MELQFLDYEFGEPKYSELECRTKDLTFSRPLYVNVELLIKETGEIQRQRVYMGDFPFMTDQGTFIINGAERVVVSQLVRSPGVYYSEVEDPTQRPRPSSRPRSSRTAAPGSSSRRATRTCSRSRSTASARSRRPRCCARSATSTNEEIAGLFAGRRRRPRAPVHRRDAGQGPDQDPARGADRGLQEAAPGRSAHRRQRPPARREPLLQLPPLRPRARRPLQVQQEAGRGRRAGWASSCEPPSERTITREDIAAIVGHLIEPQPRPAASRTTSTTSATAASAPTAS